MAPDHKLVPFVHDYVKHAERCATCDAVDARQPGARRCDAGFKLLLQAYASPSALATPFADLGGIVQSTVAPTTPPLSDESLSERIRAVLATYKDAVVQRVDADFAAAACQTGRDRDKAHKARDAETEAEENATVALLRLLRGRR